MPSGEDFLPPDATWPKTSSWQSYLLGILICLLVIVFNARLPDISFRTLFQFLAGYFLSVAAHEAGHLVGGLLVGIPTASFAVWPLQLSRQSGSWRLGWMRSAGLAGFVSVELGDGADFRKRMGILVAAGPGASAVVGIVAAMLGAKFVALWSFVFAATGFLPIASPYAVTDGVRLRMLWRDDAAADRYRSLLRIAALSKSGTPPREIDPTLIDSLGIADDGSADAHLAQIFRFNWLLDSHRVEEAGKVLAKILSHPMRDESRATWWLEAAWIEARYRHDAVTARKWRDAVPSQFRKGVNLCATHKAQAAIAFVESRWDDACAAIEAALKNLDSSDLGVASATRDDLTRLQSDVAEGRAV